MRNGKATMPSNGEWPEIMKPAEAAQYLRLSRKKFRALCKRGEIYHKREGRSILIPRSALDEWVNTPPTPVENNSSQS